MTSIDLLRCEYRTNPLGIDVTEPRFSWTIKSNRPGACQTAYRVMVSSTAEQLQVGVADRWDSGRIESWLSSLQNRPSTTVFEFPSKTASPSIVV